MAIEVGSIFISSGDPYNAIMGHHRNYLDRVWTKDSLCPKGRLSIGGIFRAIGSYPLGMVAYLLDTIRKVSLVVGNLFVLVLSFFNPIATRNYKRNRAVILLDTFVALAIGIVGAAVPPLAYRLDSYAKNIFVRMLSRDIRVAHEYAEKERKAIIDKYDPESGISKDFIRAWTQDNQELIDQNRPFHKTGIAVLDRGFDENKPDTSNKLPLWSKMVRKIRNSLPTALTPSRRSTVSD